MHADQHQQPGVRSFDDYWRTVFGADSAPNVVAKHGFRLEAGRRAMASKLQDIEARACSGIEANERAEWDAYREATLDALETAAADRT